MSDLLCWKLGWPWVPWFIHNTLYLHLQLPQGQRVCSKKIHTHQMGISEHVQKCTKFEKKLLLFPLAILWCVNWYWMSYLIFFQGDSGGPLQCNMKDGRWYLAGLTSFGSGCAKPGFPDVFTRLTHYIEWINSTLALHWKL